MQYLSALSLRNRNRYRCRNRYRVPRRSLSEAGLSVSKKIVQKPPIAPITQINRRLKQTLPNQLLQLKSRLKKSVASTDKFFSCSLASAPDRSFSQTILKLGQPSKNRRQSASSADNILHFPDGIVEKAVSSSLSSTLARATSIGMVDSSSGEFCDSHMPVLYCRPLI